MNPYEFYITPEEYKLAEMNGVDAGLLEYRVRGSGWNKHDAINKPPYRKSDEKIYYENLAAQNGIKRTTFLMRLKRGWNLKDAATLQKGVKYSNRERILSDEDLAVAKSNGINHSTAYQRIARGWVKQAAITIPTIEEEESLRRARLASPFAEMNEIHWNMIKHRNSQ